MTEPRGEFTRKFDRDVLGDSSAAAEEYEAQRRALEAQDEALEAEFVRVVEVLEYRAKWLRERFPEVKEPVKLPFRGRRFEFNGGTDHVVGWLEFRTRLTDSEQAILIQSYMELEGAFPRRYDYVSFPKERVNVDKAKRFVESKILEFASAYQSAFREA